MRDLRTLIIQETREAVPRGQNINKAFNEQQGRDESPTEWLERLRKSLQMYSRIDPNTPEGTALLRMQFVAKSWGDIRRKLEKLEDCQDRGLEELLREAQKVYVRRDEERQKAKAEILVAAVRESEKNKTPSREGKGNGPGRAPRGPPPQERITRPICYYYNVLLGTNTNIHIRTVQTMALLTLDLQHSLCLSGKYITLMFVKSIQGYIV